MTKTGTFKTLNRIERLLELIEKLIKSKKQLKPIPIKA